VPRVAVIAKVISGITVAIWLVNEALVTGCLLLLLLLL